MEDSLMSPLDEFQRGNYVLYGKTGARWVCCCCCCYLSTWKRVMKVTNREAAMLKCDEQTHKRAFRAKPKAMPLYLPHQLLPGHSVILCSPGLLECAALWVWLQHSNGCNRLRFIAADLSRHPWMCTITYLESFVQNPPAFCPIGMLQLWGKHGGHGSGFSRGILIVPFWLAEVLGWLAAQNLCIQTGGQL